MDKTPLTEEQLLKAKQFGLTCRSCWWNEGGRCYLEPCERIQNPDGWGSISTKLAVEPCIHHSSKRAVLAQFFPSNMLTIASEEKAKSEGKEPPHY